MEISNSSNYPGARVFRCGGLDKNGNFWLFGELGYDSCLTGSQEIWMIFGYFPMEVGLGSVDPHIQILII